MNDSYFEALTRVGLLTHAKISEYADVPAFVGEKYFACIRIEGPCADGHDRHAEERFLGPFDTYEAAGETGRAASLRILEALGRHLGGGEIIDHSRAAEA